MAENLMDTQLNEYLMDIQSEIAATLKHFEEHGVTINEEIEEYLIKTSKNCVKQEFDRFELKSKSEVSRTKSSLSRAKVDISSMVITRGATKRDPKDCANGNVERLKRQRLDEPNSTSGQNVDIAANVTKMSHTLFYCDHCVDLNDPSNSFSGSKNDIYQHWVAMHKEDLKPFEFYVVVLLRCFHCGETGAYHDLVKHHEEQHSSQRFMIVDQMDPKKCGICQYKDGDLLQHFRTKHASDTTLKNFNPICYSEQRIDELLSINLHQNYHSGQQPGYLICGYCQKRVDCDKYLNHFNEHKYKFSCLQCAYHSFDFVELVLHEKIAHNFHSLDHHCREFEKWIKNKHLNTRLVFGNCLILQNWNVIGTKYDAGKHFEAFIDDFLNKKKKESNRRLEMEKSNAAQSIEAMQTNQSEINAELNEQRKLVDTVFVSCIPPILDKCIDPYEIFLKICQILELNVCRDDIEEIYRNYSGLVVKFHRIAIKEMVLKKSDGKFVWSNDLFQMEDDRMEPWKIRICFHLTPFYRDLWSETATFQQQNRGYTYRMSNDGIAIRSKATSIEYIINTKDELQELLLKC